MSDFAHFEIEAEANGTTRVIVNGADVSESVHGVMLQAVRGHPPVLRLDHVAASGPIEGNGIVQVVEEVDGGLNPAEAIQTFLANLDGAELERQATKAMDEEPALGAGAAFLVALRKATGAA